MKLLILSVLLNLAVIPANKKHLLTKVITTEKLPLLERKWEMQEIRFLYDNEEYYYNRYDDSHNNMNFDNDYIVFRCGGNGVYHQTDNIEYPLKWHFIENKDNAIEFTISKFRNNSDLVVNWENIEITMNTIKYTEYYTHKNGLHCLGAGTRMSKDSVEKGAGLISSR
ncbi:MAG: hypothetical protein QM737_23555 [Ferruginibacter sp.]